VVGVAGMMTIFLILFNDLVRAVLGFLNAIAISLYATNARKAFGKGAAVWYIVMQCGQFHVPYYASRPLPNMFAFGLSRFALFSCEMLWGLRC